MDAGLEALQTQVADLETEDAALAEGVTNLVTEITGLNEAVEALKTANPGITDEELAPITSRVEALVTHATAIVEAAKAAPPAAG